MYDSLPSPQDPATRPFIPNQLIPVHTLTLQVLHVSSLVSDTWNFILIKIYNIHALFFCSITFLTLRGQISSLTPYYTL